MSIDFFNNPCSEPPLTDLKFGICDNQDNKKAFTDKENPDKWIAEIENKSGRQIIFIPIDNCITILKSGVKEQESTCDGMLTFTDSLFLVELKEQATGGWLPKAIGQIENTVKLLIANHDLSTIRFKKGFACNKKHSKFTVIENELNMGFFKTYGFRLDAQTRIKIK